MAVKVGNGVDGLRRYWSGFVWLSGWGTDVMGSVATGAVWYGCSGSDFYGKVGSGRYWFGCHGGFWKGHSVLVGFGSPGSDWQVVTSSGKARLGRKFAKDWIVEVWRGPTRSVLADTVRR